MNAPHTLNGGVTARKAGGIYCPCVKERAHLSSPSHQIRRSGAVAGEDRILLQPTLEMTSKV